MIIAHNISAMIACRNIETNSILAGKAMERLSTGYRINRSADDPAGLAISERMRSQIRGLEQAARNAQDGISVIQVAEGALNENHEMLQRMKELAVQASNGSCSDIDRKSIQEEINQLTSQINFAANNTEFNGKQLLNSSLTKYDGVHSEMKLQIGANAGQTMSIYFDDMSADAIHISGAAGNTVTSKDGTIVAKYATEGGVTGGNANEYALDVSTPENANAAIEIYNDAINTVSIFRGKLGATQNALERRIDYINNAAENLTAAESRIRDADMAKEMMEYTKYTMLQQVAQAMLIQSNKQQQSILELLKSL